jgi:hypothetical protein
MFVIDFYSGSVILFTLFLTVIFIWHSNRILGNTINFKTYGYKDSDDYVLGKKYNEHIGSLDTNLKLSRDQIVSFLGIWKIVFVIYFIVTTIILYGGYVSKVQVVERLDDLERRVLILENER